MRWPLLPAGLAGLLAWTVTASGALQVGTAVVSVTPTNFPVIVNGSFFSKTASTVKTPVNARALFLDDGREPVAIVVVDSCMMPRDLLDEVKQQVVRRTRLRSDRILIASTHCHSAPSSVGALGTDADPAYVPFLRDRLVEAILSAQARLHPARVGWASFDASAYTAVRRWIRRPDRLDIDPFGERTVRATMHAAANWDNVTGPSGPEDPEFGMISFQTPEGRPLAVLANFSMHYFSDQAISADYFGLFCDGLKKRLVPEKERSSSPFVALLSHGCSGDIWRRDYAMPKGERGEQWTLESYTGELLDLAQTALSACDHHEVVELRMAESRLPLNYRVPDEKRLAWARGVMAAMEGPLPSTKPEVYAREQLILHERRATEVVVQALRIGELAMATTPTETYALTGLHIKAKSPFAHTMVLDLANGGDGYIPPPEQHVLGGYNTWTARSAGLEVQAEPKIAEAALTLLEQVAAKPRRPASPAHGPAARAMLQAEPLAYWRMEEFGGTQALDLSGHGRHGVYEPGVVFYLPGPRSDLFAAAGGQNRCTHFAGGRMVAEMPAPGKACTISLWCWNGMPLDARETLGGLFEYGGDRLGLSGGHKAPGCLVFSSKDTAGERRAIYGKTQLERWSWNHVVYIRDGSRVSVYLNDHTEPELDFTLPVEDHRHPEVTTLYVGGYADPGDSWEGRLDEIAFFDHACPRHEFPRIGPTSTSSAITP